MNNKLEVRIPCPQQTSSWLACFKQAQVSTADLRPIPQIDEDTKKVRIKRSYKNKPQLDLSGTTQNYTSITLYIFTIMLLINPGLKMGTVHQNIFLTPTQSRSLRIKVNKDYSWIGERMACLSRSQNRLQWLHWTASALIYLRI